MSYCIFENKNEFEIQWDWKKGGLRRRQFNLRLDFRTFNENETQELCMDTQFLNKLIFEILVKLFCFLTASITHKINEKPTS